MEQQGCCAGNGDIGECGTKFLRVKRMGVEVEKIEVCRNLVRFDDGKWGCEDYLNRPPICRAFYCGRK
jgi:hypothetical protein